MHLEESSSNTSFSLIETITIEVFYNVLKTGDLTLLGAYKNIKEVWLDTIDDYCKRSKVDDSNLNQEAKIESLKVKYSYILELLNKLRYSHYLIEVEGFKENKARVAEILRSRGYLYHNEKEFELEFSRLLKQTDSLKMKIVIEDSKIDKTNKKTAINIWKELVNLERITRIKLDPKTDVLAKLIEVRSLAQEINKSKKTK